MKCPHCNVEFSESWNERHVGVDSTGNWWVQDTHCVACSRLVIFCRTDASRSDGSGFRFMVWPKGFSRPAVPAEVPDDIAEDYREACLVLSATVKASAALSRRCLQNLLRLKAGVRESDLGHEIQQVLEARSLPSYLSDALDAVRVIGNFAAHGIKSQSTGQIVEVEPGEADWNLAILEGLFDFYFVQPQRLQGKRDALNAKLQDAGMRPLKS